MSSEVSSSRELILLSTYLTVTGLIIEDDVNGMDTLPSSREYSVWVSPLINIILPDGILFSSKILAFTDTSIVTELGASS